MPKIILRGMYGTKWRFSILQDLQSGPGPTTGIHFSSSDPYSTAYPPKTIKSLYKNHFPPSRVGVCRVEGAG